MELKEDLVEAQVQDAARFVEKRLKMLTTGINNLTAYASMAMQIYLEAVNDTREIGPFHAEYSADAKSPPSFNSKKSCKIPPSERQGTLFDKRADNGKPNDKEAKLGFFNSKVEDRRVKEVRWKSRGL